MLATVPLQTRRVIRRVTRVLDQKDAQSTHIAHGVEHVLITLLCRTPKFVSKGTKETAPPQEDEENAMDEDGESVEEDSSSDSDDEGDIPLFGRRKGKSVEDYGEEEPPTQGLRPFRTGLGMGGTNKVPAVTPGYGPEPPRVAGTGFKRCTGLPATLYPRNQSPNPFANATSFRACRTHPCCTNSEGQIIYGGTYALHEDLRVPWCQNDSEDGVVGCNAFTSVGFHVDHPFRAPG